MARREGDTSRTPSWAGYAAPMRPVDGGRQDAQLHPRYWQAELEASARTSLHWGFLAFFLGYASFYLLGQLLALIVRDSADRFDSADPPDLGPLLVLAFVPNLLLGLLPVLFSVVKGSGPVRDFGLRFSARDVKVGLLCGLASIAGGVLISLVIVALGDGEEPESGLERLTENTDRTVWLAAFALFAFLGAPLTEELLMRGALWGALEHYRIPRFVILGLTSLIFALIHEEPSRMPVLLWAGLALGTARMLTGRIGASIVAHATNNFLPAVFIFFAAGS